MTDRTAQVKAEQALRSLVLRSKVALAWEHRQRMREGRIPAGQYEYAEHLYQRLKRRGGHDEELINYIVNSALTSYFEPKAEEDLDNDYDPDALLVNITWKAGYTVPAPGGIVGGGSSL